MISIKKDNEAFFITSCDIGDIVYGMAYLDAWSKDNVKYTPVIIADSTKKDIFEAYDIHFKVIYFDKSSIIGKRILINYNGSRLFSLFGKRKKIFNTIPIQIYGNNRHMSCLSLLEEYLQVLDGKVIYPVVKGENNEMDDKFNIFGRNSIIINPYSSGREYCPCLDLFEKLIVELSAAGYDVYSNIVGEQKPLKNTRPL